jgi:hypothetical protein
MQIRDLKLYQRILRGSISCGIFLGAILCCTVTNLAQGPNPEPSVESTKENIEKVLKTMAKEASPTISSPTPTPVAVVIESGKANAAKLPLPHPAAVKPDLTENPEVSRPAASPTPEDPLLKKAKDRATTSYYEALMANNNFIVQEYEHNKWALQDRVNVFTWQRFASKVIFYVVILLVFLGMTFSGIQFFISLRHTKKHQADSGLTTLEASWGGVKLKSSVLGVIILVISFLFFYMYLALVFQISAVSE